MKASEKKLILCIRIAFVVSAVCVFLAIFANASSPFDKYSETTYTIQVGDSLWSVAEMFCPNEIQIRDYIKEIMRSNELVSKTVYPGQILTVFVNEVVE